LHKNLLQLIAIYCFSVFVYPNKWHVIENINFVCQTFAGLSGKQKEAKAKKSPSFPGK